MAGMEEALVARLKAAAGVGGVVAWGELPRRAATPSSTLTFVSPGREWTHDGPLLVERSRIQIDSWGETAIAALGRARAVLAEMEQPRSIGGVAFHPAQLEGRMGPEPEDTDADGTLWRVMLDVSFYHEPEGS